MPAPALPPVPAPDCVLEAALYVDDLDAAEHFYGSVLGLERVLKVPGRHVFFRAGPGVLLIFDPAATAKPPLNPDLPVPPHGATGPGHACLGVSRAGLAAYRDRLMAAGIGIEAEFDWPNGAGSLYCRDPAGNSVELAEPRLWARPGDEQD